MRPEGTTGYSNWKEANSFFQHTFTHRKLNTNFLTLKQLQESFRTQERYANQQHVILNLILNLRGKGGIAVPFVTATKII